MIHLSGSIPFYNTIISANITIIFLSMLFFIYFIILKKKLIKWIKTDDSEKLKSEDTLYLIFARKGMKNALLSYYYSVVLYCIMYIVK